MDQLTKPYIHLTINAVDTVAHDPEGRYDPERFDRYATYVEARDAALTSVELMLDERDYDGDDHREELERMLALLESAETFDVLAIEPGYQWFIDRLILARPTAA